MVPEVRTNSLWHDRITVARQKGFAGENFPRPALQALRHVASANPEPSDNKADPMQVTLELPEDLARLLGQNSAGLTRAALEALALEGLRAGKLAVAQARRLIGISSRYEMDGFLKSHGVLLSLTGEDVERDAETARSFRSK